MCGSAVATTARREDALACRSCAAAADPALATGTIAVGGTLGILIPPSVILVIYAITTEQNIAKLFMAALVPGLLAVVLYMLVIRLRVLHRPELGPPAERVPWPGVGRPSKALFR